MSVVLAVIGVAGLDASWDGRVRMMKVILREIRFLYRVRRRNLHILLEPLTPFAVLEHSILSPTACTVLVRVGDGESWWGGTFTVDPLDVFEHSVGTDRLTANVVRMRTEIRHAAERKGSR